MEAAEIRGAFRAIEGELCATYVEREEPIRGLMVGLLARQHVLLLGPPGTGKSAMAEDLCSRVSGQYFRWLLARTSTPEELFGPVSLRALEADSYRRVTTGKLPEAHVALLDECWKANSAVLNSLLSVLNERLFFNDAAAATVPLHMAVGASNELPEDREELGALWDRFALRYQVDYIRDPQHFAALLAGSLGAPTVTRVSLADLEAAQAAVAAVRVNGAAGAMVSLRGALAQQQIVASDRRWRQSLRLVQAQAWLEGRDVATEEDLGILMHALWQEPSELPRVRQIVLATVNPLAQQLAELTDGAREQWEIATAAATEAERDESKREAATKAGIEAAGKLKRTGERLRAMQEDAARGERGTAPIEAARAQVAAWAREVAARCLGVSV